MREMVIEQDRLEQSHPFAQWLSNRLPIHVPEPTTVHQLRRWSQWADRQIVRRAVVAMVVLVLVTVFACWTGETYIDRVRDLDAQGLFHRIVAFVTAASMIFQVGILLLWTNLTYMLAGSSTDDLAMLDYGMPYDKLTMSQRREMMVRSRARMFECCFRADERQSLQLERAERIAYRLLRRTAIAIVILSWAAYLIAPKRAFGWVLQWGRLMMNSPLMLTWLLMVLIALPMLIRIWTEPDEVGEPRVVTMERGA
jgi:hypothetical protein